MPIPLLGAFLSASIGALARKAMVAIGLGTITYTGLQAAFDSVQANIISNYGTMSGASMQLANLAGVGDTLGIILGAMSARVGMAVVSKIASML